MRSAVGIPCLLGGEDVKYIISMLSLFQLRRTEPNMNRPFRAPCYPYFPAFALLGACVCMATMVYYNPLIFGLFVAFMVIGYVYFLLTSQNRTGATPATLPDLI